MNTGINERYLDVFQTAQYMGNVSTSLVRKLAYSGDLRSCKIGRCLRFDKADIDIWLECHKKGVKYHE